MFVEPHFQKGQIAAEPTRKTVGWIEVISGCMFSGKTEELIRRLKRSMLAKQEVRIFKPSIDTRYDIENVVSHNQNAIQSTPVQNSKEIILAAVDCEVIGIDEAQFFDESLPEVCNFLANLGKRVIIAGLDMDYTGKPFQVMAELHAIAEFVTKVHAICMQCGSVASYSYRLGSETGTVLLGEKDHYEARCRQCFQEKDVMNHIPDGYES